MSWILWRPLWHDLIVDGDPPDSWLSFNVKSSMVDIAYAIFFKIAISANVLCRNVLQQCFSNKTISKHLCVCVFAIPTENLLFENNPNTCKVGDTKLIVSECFEPCALLSEQLNTSFRLRARNVLRSRKISWMMFLTTSNFPVATLSLIVNIFAVPKITLFLYWCTDG